MKALKSLALAGLLMMHAVAPSRALVITKDPGGVIVDFIKKYSTIRDSGEKVVVDGECDSSCTLFLGLLPASQYCVTRRAALGFHTASTRIEENGKVTFEHSPEFSAMVWNIYPGKIRSYLKRVGWNGDDMNIAHPEIVYIRGIRLQLLGIHACRREDLS